MTRELGAVWFAFNLGVLTCFLIFMTVFYIMRPRIIEAFTPDFDAIWDRYYTAASRRTEAGLTYDELKQVVLGGTE